MINADDEVSLAYLLEPTFQVENSAGKPITNGYIEVYLHGTRTKYYCASDFDGTLHPFKIPLDSLGANVVLASPAHSYDIYIYNKFGTLVMSRYNIVPATGDGAVIKDVVTIKSEDNTVSVTSSDQTNWNLSIKDTVDRVQQNEQEISNVKVDIENVNTNITNLTEVVNGHTTEIGQIKEDVAGIESTLSNKKDKQPIKNFNGSSTKTIKTITQNDNGELTVEFEDIDLPSEVPNVEITSADKSIQVTETTDVQTNTKKFDLSSNIVHCNNEKVLWTGPRFTHGTCVLNESFLHFEQIRFKICSEDQDNWRYFYYPCINDTQYFNASMTQIWPELNNQIWMKNGMWMATSEITIIGSYQCNVNFSPYSVGNVNISQSNDWLGIYEIVGINRIK